MSEMVKAAPALDATCSICKQRGDNHGTYAMSATCGNCQTVSVIELTKTHGHPTRGGGPECPACGMREWVGWKLA